MKTPWWRSWYMGLGAVALVATMGLLCWHMRGTSVKPTLPPVSAPQSESPDHLPKAVRLEYDRMAAIYASIRMDTASRESQWRRDLVAQPLLPTEQVRSELSRARELVAVVEKMLPLDENEFAARPSSRIWMPESRLVLGERPDPVPPIPDAEVLAGPLGAVAVHSGEFLLDEMDMALPTRGGIGFTFRRNYRLHSEYDGPMGYGWDHNHNLRIVADSGNLSDAKLLYLRGGGFDVQFGRDGQSWVPQRGAFLDIEVTERNGLVLTDGLRTHWAFEPAVSSPEGRACWRIRMMRTRHGESAGNHLIYRYASGTDVLASVEDPFGQIIRFYYDSNGRLRLVAAPGKRVEFAYESDGSLTSATIPQVARSLSESVPLQTKYGYRLGGGRPWCVSRRVNRSEHEVFADVILSNDAPDYGRVAASGYRLVASADEKIVWSLTRSRDDGNLIVEVTPPAPEPVILYRFPGRAEFPWLPSRATIPSRKATWTFDYNQDGLCIVENHADGYQIRRIYDTGNADARARQNCLDESTWTCSEKLVGRLRAKGRQTEFWPGTAYFTRITHYEIDDSEAKKSLLEERYEYCPDALDLLASHMGRESTWYFWNPRGQLLGTVDGCGSVVLYYYTRELPENDMTSFYKGFAEGGGVLVRTVEDAPINDLKGIVLPKDRDRLANLPQRLCVLPPVSEVTHLLYDRLGRKIGQVGPAYQAFSAVNRLGQPLAMWNTADGLEVTHYDGGLRRQRVYHRFMSSHEGVLHKSYLGSALTAFSGRFYLSSYEYDAWGRVAALSPTDEPPSGQAEAPIFRYERYPSGTLKRLIDPAGTARCHEYNTETGLPIRIGLECPEGQTITLQRFLRHSPSGLLLSFRDDHGDAWSTQLDSLGRPFEETQPDRITVTTHHDGLDRPISSVSLLENQVVDEHEWQYTPSGRTERIMQTRFHQDQDGRIRRVGRVVLEENCYDAAGRIITQRGIRNDAWRHIMYDGIGRVIAEKSPEGNWTLALYRDGTPVVVSTLMRSPESQDFAALREVKIATDRFRPYVTVPVDKDGTPRWARASIQRWSPEGHLVEELQLEGLHTRTAYDTRGNRVEETVRPAHEGDKGEAQHRIWLYDEAGRPLTQTTSVRSLALFFKYGVEESVIPRRVAVPQTIEWHYDSLGRLVRVDRPDGLQISREYSQDSAMVTRMTWRHAIKPAVVQRDIEFHYGPMRRLTALTRPDEREPLQEFAYNAWGQCTESTDRTGNEHVVVNRDFDNLGLLWREQIRYGHTILQDLDVEINPEAGTQRLHWHQPGEMPGGFWTQARYQSDLDGRVSSLSLNGRDFCQWGYQGQTPVSRAIPSLLTQQTMSLDPMCEIAGVAVDMRENGTWTGLSRMRYTLDERGSVIASAVTLGGIGGRPKSTVSQYSDLDAYRRTIAFAQEAVAWPDLVARHRDMLTATDSPAAILASRTHRDEAGNVFAEYQGRQAALPLETSRERGKLYSSGPFLALDDGEQEQTGAERLAGRLALSDRFELTSNRLTSTSVQGQVAMSYKYDLLGQLSEYDGLYWEGQKDTPVSWSLGFDVLGRLTHMQAEAREPAKGRSNDNAQMVATLEFAYDAWNRRIVKRVIDHETNRIRCEATLYCDERQTIILEQQAGLSWSPTQQYVWGASAAEALQVVTSPYSSGIGSSRALETYALHQDRSMDVVFATRVVGGTVQATPLATYLYTGENSSLTHISGVKSSMEPSDLEACWNGRVDDGRQTQWRGDGGDWIWLEVQLPEPRRVSGLTIWTDEFPNDFEVYAVDNGRQLPTNDEVDSWRRRLKSEGRLITSVEKGLFFSHQGCRRKLSMLECPYELVLNGTRTERLLVLWQNSPRLNRRVSVNELSVSVLPETATALGQNGCWLDRETGLYYHHNRYRLPSMNGKFISPDPLGFLGGPDLYAYANNNPLHWHDPDGQFAHIIWGAGIGAVLGGGAYLFECWLTGEEISWTRLAIRTGTGAVAGAVAALTFGASSSFLAAKGFSSAANALLTNTLTGGAAGFTSGFLGASSEAMVFESQSFGDAFMLGLSAGVEGAAIGAVGGAVGGAAFSKFHNFGFTSGNAALSFMAATASGAAGGAAGGAVAGAWQGYQQHGWSTHMLHYAGSGALRGAAYGAAIGGTGWGAARALGRLQPMGHYPEELPKPEGLLIRTQPGQRTYGGLPVQTGTARHHVTPLSLGGRDIPSNIKYLPLDQHRIPHPPTSVKDAPLGTIFY